MDLQWFLSPKEVYYWKSPQKVNVTIGASWYLNVLMYFNYDELDNL